MKHLTSSLKADAGFESKGKMSDANFQALTKVAPWDSYSINNFTRSLKDRLSNKGSAYQVDTDLSSYDVGNQKFLKMTVQTSDRKTNTLADTRTSEHATVSHSHN